MTDHQRTTEPPVPPVRGDGDGAGVLVPFPVESPLPPARTKIRWLRLLALLTGLGTLATVSTLFGMMMAVAADLPELDVLDVPTTTSKMYDRTGRVELGTLTGNQRRILVKSADIAPVMKHAIVAIEDRRFFTNSGVDLRGITRALYQDVVQRRVVQGGSTITQQLVKNRLEAQNDRTLFQKLRESAIAFHMTQKWDKQKILQNYLNTIYFGNGAYGIEAAAKTYFGTQHAGCGEAGQRNCAAQLEPHEAALLAGIVASPSGYDPVANPDAARRRRDLVLLRMLEQGYISRAQYEAGIAEAPPSGQGDIRPPREESEYPYFTTWVRQQVVDKVGTGPAFEGSLHVRTTLDVDMQKAADDAVRQMTSIPGAPAAALVALDNATGEVVALVGGTPGATAQERIDAYDRRPFNLATQGQRQPGSAFKPFTLVEALRRRKVRPDQVFTSKKKYFCVTRRKGKCREFFEVNNYEDRYAGISTLANATAFSDNSVYAEMGIKTGTRNIARLAQRMGIRTKVSTNFAITLGGLEQGVTVLDMAHAYQTIARDGRLIYRELSPGAEDEDATPGPAAIQEICKRPLARKGCDDDDLAELEDSGDQATNGGKALERNVLRCKRCASPYEVSQQVKGMLAGVVKFGSGRRASLGPKIPVFGKTGTTEDYGDAWFVGFTKEYTVAVWVGYPDAVRPMKPPLFSYQGDPVAGGTWPAAIWQAFMKRALEVRESRKPKKDRRPEDDLPVGPTPQVAVPDGAAAPSPTAAAPRRRNGGSGTRPRQPAPAEAPQEPAQEQPAPQAPQPNATVAPEQQPATGEGGTAPPGEGESAPP